MSGKNVELLPKSIQEIAEVLGVYGAVNLVDRLPVIKKRDRSPAPMLYVPKAPRPGGFLTEVLGSDYAGRLTSSFGGEILWPARNKWLYLAARDRAVRAMAADGVDRDEIAAIFCLSPRSIRNIMNRPPRPVEALLPESRMEWHR